MGRWRDLAAAVAFGLLVCGASARAAVPDDPKAVGREALSSLLLGNAAAFAAVTLPVDGVQAILRPSPPSGEERARIDEALSRVNLTTRYPTLFEGEPVDEGKAPPVGSRIVYRTQLGGSLVPVVVVRTAAGWRVDPRYWVAERAQQAGNLEDGTPPMVVKRFLFHIMNRDTDELKALTYVPSAVEELTRHNSMPGADRGHVALLCVEMPVAPAREGEVVRTPLGTRVVAGAVAEEAVYVGLLGTIEVPFRLRKVDGAWKVLPEPYFEWLRSLGSI